MSCDAYSVCGLTISVKITGGASVSVGASDGYVTGGGHGALTNVYGLAVDNVLQMKVLIANGTFLAANRCQNQDLFFAMRGGGGGTFGIVLNTTSRIYREVPMQVCISSSLGFRCVRN